VQGIYAANGFPSINRHDHYPMRLHGIKAVVFDVFGTLAEIGKKRYPYAKLMRSLHRAGREPQGDDTARIMSHNVGLAGVTELFNVELPASLLNALECELYAELPTVRLYPETVATLTVLRDAGYKIGLCSNLAAPYAVPIKILLPFELDAYAWSFEVGAVKPDPVIYEKVCADLNCLPQEVAMVGDTLEADYNAPRRLGMHGFHLARNGSSPIAGHLATLDAIFPLLAAASGA
jgi:FMN phosphatase YigB (HAD superfamily)